MFSNKQTQEHPEVPELAWQTSGGAVDEIRCVCCAMNDNFYIYVLISLQRTIAALQTA